MNVCAFVYVCVSMCMFLVCPSMSKCMTEGTSPTIASYVNNV